VILIDANLLLYAYSPRSAEHDASKAWLESTLSGLALVRFSWMTPWAFLRIGTRARVFERPFTICEARKCRAPQPWRRGCREPRAARLVSRTRQATVDWTMPSPRLPLQSWTPEQIEQGREWVAAWKRAGPELERVRREELRTLDAYAAIALLVGPADYTVEPRAPRPSSGLVEQQRLFQVLRRP
jgi:hypothetical protein